MDEQNNPIAHQFDQMIAASTQAHREQIANMMSQPAAPAASPAQTKAPANDYWFLNQPVAQPKLGKNQAVFSAPSVVHAQDDTTSVIEPTAEEEAIAEHAKAEHAKPSNIYSHLKTIQPLGVQQQQAEEQAKQAKKAADKPMTPPSKPVILELANNNDLNVATLARQANKDTKDKPDDGEVVIALR
jgi:hypothetical protein